MTAMLSDKLAVAVLDLAASAGAELFIWALSLGAPVFDGNVAGQQTLSCLMIKSANEAATDSRFARPRWYTPCGT
jgi:hypothetical protein